MKKIIEKLYILKECEIGEPSSCIYLLNTQSEDSLILIDTGLNFNFKESLSLLGFNPRDIKHCFLTHGHFDHTDGCKDLIQFNPKIRFYAHRDDIKLAESVLHKELFKIDFKVTDIFKEKVTILKIGSYEFKCFHIPGHTPGGVAYLTRIDNHNILFVGDICGGGIKLNGGDYSMFKKSLKLLLELNPDILCDGHMNVIEGSEKAIQFIEKCLEINECLHIGLEINPKDALNWYKLALVFYQLKIYDSAQDACNYSLKMDSNNSEAKELLVEIQKYNPPKYEAIEKYLKNIYGDDYF